MSNTPLHHRLRDLKRRLFAISLSASVAWGLAAGGLLLLLCMWLDLGSELSPVLRVICFIGSALLALITIGTLAMAAWRHGAPAAMARRLDRAAGAQGQILAGVDLLMRPRGALAGGESAITAGLAQLAVERAGALAARISSPSAVPAKPVLRPLAALILLTTAALLIAVGLPRLAATQWARFSDPFGDHPPYSRIQISVNPGDTQVVYGGSLDIWATASGEAVDSLDLVVKNQDASAEEKLPMFPEPGGTWRATLTNVTLPARYFVATHGARSKQFGIGVITTPKLEGVRFRITPPAYTHRPPLEGPLPAGGLAALPGTLVQVWAKSNRPLSAGTLQSDSPQGIAPKLEAAPTTPELADEGVMPEFRTPPPGDHIPGTGWVVVDKGRDRVTGSSRVLVRDTQGNLSWINPGDVLARASAFVLQPVAAGANEVTGSFIVRSAGTIGVSVSDAKGQASTETFTAPVTVLRDERPFVRILEPKPDSFATPDITLNVEVLAEDDCGISGLQLFRGLNESRVTSGAIPVPRPEPVRFPASVPLPLSAYGVVPGDVVKLYARVEDNDPSGAKGSESTVVTVRIISNEQMQQMLLSREGLEVLLSKYEQASRRLEAANQTIDEMRKTLEKADPDSQVAKEMRDQLEKAADQFFQDADKLDELAAQGLPFDLDQALKSQLEAAAKTMAQTADAMKKLAAKPGLSAGAAAQELADAQQRLGGEREEFKEEAEAPLEHLEKIYPLIEDEARFIELYERQKDLAERMASLAGHDNEDNPQIKNRMRDLQTEQRDLRTELRGLVDDIENRAAELPEDERLDGLRETAKNFAQAVRKSSAADEMAAAESGLEEFQGSRAATASRAAADTLEGFLGKCKSVGEQGQACLKFQPKLSQGLGNTIEELLEAEGLGLKPGKGAGGGAGYSARRSSLRNVGLYGHLPSRGQDARAGGGRAQRGSSADGAGEAPPGSPADAHSTGRLTANGQSDAVVPDRYKRQVGEYFQRVADELGQTPSPRK